MAHDISDKQKPEKVLRDTGTDVILRKEDIKQITGFSDVTIREMEAHGHWPRRFKINPAGRVVGWWSADVRRHLAKLAGDTSHEAV